MTRHRLALTGVAVALAAGAAAAQPSSSATAASPAAPAASADAAADIDPEAIQALQRMRAYLGTLSTFQVKTVSTQDLVLDDGQTIQLDGGAEYKVRRPNGFEIKVTAGNKVRDFLYDGKQLTVYAPQLGFYAQAPAPPTIRQTLDAAYDKYGISFPLEDLFRWSEPGEHQKPMKAAMVVGDSAIDGTPTTQYAFRQGAVDWQVWIQKGDQPLPRKVVIIDQSDDARPAYTVRLSWTVNPAIAADAFIFRPDKDAKQIHLAAVQ